MHELPKTFILFDSEYTAWKGSQERQWSAIGEHREIVQIAALKVKNPELVESASFVTYIKPRINPILSSYFTRLTGITQNIVNSSGTDLDNALMNFKMWCGDLPIYSFGRDGEVVFENCLLADIECPFRLQQFRNIRPLFDSYGINEKGFNSCNIVEAFGVRPTRRAHNALNDVRTILDALVLLSNRNNSTLSDSLQYWHGTAGA